MTGKHAQPPEPDPPKKPQPEEQQFAPDVHLHWWEKVIGFFVLLFGGGKP